MLRGLPADARRLGHLFQTRLHRLQYRLVLPACDAPVGASRTLRLDRASRTGRRPVFVDRLALLDCLEAPDRTLTGRTSVLIEGGVVAKVALVELPFGQIIRSIGFGHQHVDPRLLALEDLRSGVVAAIRKGGELLSADGGLSLLAH